MQIANMSTNLAKTAHRVKLETEVNCVFSLFDRQMIVLTFFVLIWAISGPMFFVSTLVAEHVEKVFTLSHLQEFLGR